MQKKKHPEDGNLWQLVDFVEEIYSYKRKLLWFISQQWVYVIQGV